MYGLGVILFPKEPDDLDIGIVMAPMIRDRNAATHAEFFARPFDHYRIERCIRVSDLPDGSAECAVFVAVAADGSMTHCGDSTYGAALRSALDRYRNGYAAVVEVHR